MKLTKKEYNMLIALAGILIAVAAYYFGYQKLNAKADALAAESTQMESRIATYESWLPNQEQYEQDTQEMQAQITAWVNLFPANNLPEDDIKLAFEMDTTALSEKYLFINTLAFTDATLLHTTDYSGTGTDGAADTTAAADASAATDSDVAAATVYPTYSLYQSGATYGVECTYNGLKNMIETIYDTSDRKSVESVNVSFDSSTGHLAGNVVMNDYYLYGTEKLYAQPTLPSVHTGTDNIFGTIETGGESTDEATDATGEGEAAQ